MFRGHLKTFSAFTICFLVMGSMFPLHQANAATISVGEAVPLSQLITGVDNIVVGDKLFDEFFYNPTGGAPAAEDVIVIGVQQDGGYGLVFTSGGFAAGGLRDTSLDAGLGFRVSVTDPNQLIVGAELFGTAGTLGTGDARISEAFNSAPGSSLLIRNFRVDDELITARSSDRATFAQGVSEVFVIKDISIEVPEVGDPRFDLANLAELTTFRQLFFQEAIPEPTTMSLAAFAIVGIVCSRKRI